MSGARLPLQNLWRADTMPDEMPLTLLPVSQYYMWLMISMLVVGGLVAGFTARLLTGHTHRVTIGLGVLGAHSFAVAQSYWQVASGLGTGGRATAYFTGMLLTAVVGTGLAQFVFWLVSGRSVPVAALGTALAAAPFTMWLHALVLAFVGQHNPPRLLHVMDGWLPAVLVGVALAWSGVASSRAWVWALALLGLWLIPTTADAVQFVAGSRALLSVPSEIPGAMLRSWFGGAPEYARPLWHAAVIGVLGAGLRRAGSGRANSVGAPDVQRLVG